MSFDHWSVVPGDPTDTSIQLRPLEPATGQSLARDLVLKTRRRKGLSDSIAVSKYLEDEVGFFCTFWPPLLHSSELGELCPISNDSRRGIRHEGEDWSLNHRPSSLSVHQETLTSWVDWSMDGLVKCKQNSSETRIANLHLVLWNQ